ncbi:MAG: UDP-N-acetylglucosamine 2-epimerase (non-hydrolyzing) [Myxococcaceae bacterium]|nr:UDP-N-acetylglucosamine 2-epimerase (non-hydrolyzing) [Myxococcaceae bacterium]
MKRFGLIVGTRPNFVKASAVTRALEARGVKAVLIHTGQHHDAALSDAFFKRLELPAPDHHLGVQSGTRGEQLGEMTSRLSKLLPGLKLDALLVVGDVTSTVAGALAADACDVPLAHVEAGLRSFDLEMPEERNRKLVDAVAKWLFVSEPAGVENLRREGRSGPGAGVHLVGNVMIDTLLRFRDEAAAAQVWRRFQLEKGRYAVATLHRPSNVDGREALAESIACLSLVAKTHPVLFAAHPRTQARLRDFGLALPGGVTMMPPLDYLDFIGLMAGAHVVLTDSGGAQEETTVLGAPCLTMRENTERPITCEKGTSRLVGRSAEKVAKALEELRAGAYPRGGQIPLWDGAAGARIADLLLG